MLLVHTAVMSDVVRSLSSNEPINQQSDTIAEVVKKLLSTLPKSEQQRILSELSAILEPIPAPRAGEILDAIIQLLRRKQDWSVTDVKGEVAASGVQATPKEIYNALGYLVRKGHVKRVGYGRYLVEGAPLITSEDFGGEPGGYEDD